MLNPPNSRVTNIAKDFSVKNKTVLEILESCGLEGKKNTTVLSTDEFAIVVELLSKEKQIRNMEQYLAGTVDVPHPDQREAAPPEPPKAESVPADAPAAAKAKETAAPSAAKEPEKAKEPSGPSGQTQPVRDIPEPRKAESKQAPAEPAGASNPPAAQAASSVRPHAPAPASDPAGRKTQGPGSPVRPPVSAGTQTPVRQSAGTAPNGFRPRPAQQPFAPNQGGFQRPAFGQQRPGYGKPGPGSKNAEKSRHDSGRFEDKDSPRHTFRPAAPKIAQPQATSYSKPTATGGSTRVVDTRGSGNVDLSKYDEKLDNLVPEAAQNYSGAKQKLKKQNNRPQFDKKKKGSDKEREAIERMRKEALEKSKKIPSSIVVPAEIQVNELAAKLHVTNGEVVKKLIGLGVMASVNQMIDFDTAALVADEFGSSATQEVVVTIEERLFTEAEDSDGDLVPRAPVVCVMGHVDHGKTSLLDAIRHTNVTAGEAGGITQAIGAYRVSINGRDITFLDTPGHEAFTAMRARGAKSTDIAILVVAADDGIMPQTVEAINHAKAADIPIVVAINKMDKPHANPDLVKQGLTAYDLVPEEWGGDVICVPVSALTGMGIEELLENVLLVADMKELSANPNRRAKGLVLESRLDKGKGPVATVLVQNGTLHAGDVIIAGTAVGRVRAMTNDKGSLVKDAGPSVPVEITGLSEIPQAGDEFAAVEDERMARELADQRRDSAKEEQFKANARANLDTLFEQIREGVKDLNIVVKADVAGSVEAVKASLIKLSNEEVKVNVIHAAVGGITEGDVMLAAASNAIIVGFSVRPDKSALDSAEVHKVEIRTYRIIYECIDEIEAAIKGMLAPTYKEALHGHAVVRQTIHVPSVGTIAGSYIQDGKVTRSSQIRVLRDGIVIFEDKIKSLRRFKDDVREVTQGYECGIGLERFNDIKEGDVLEAFAMEEISSES